MRKRAGGFAVFAGGLALLVTACGGGSSPYGASPSKAPASSSACGALAGFTGPLSDHGSAPATGATLSITADDFFFAPTCETAVRPGVVTLVVHNPGRTLHNVEVKEQGIDMDVEPGETVSVQVKVGDKTLQYVCKYHWTSGMVGALLPGAG